MFFISNISVAVCIVLSDFLGSQGRYMDSTLASYCSCIHPGYFETITLDESNKKEDNIT